MKISKAELIEILDNLYDSCPTFTNPTEIPDSLYDDIRDDIYNAIQNCGRYPLSKFIKVVGPLYYIKRTSPDDFDIIMEHLSQAISD